MTATQIRSEFLPFCYEHHIVMNPDQILSTTEERPTHEATFACIEPDCLVRYNSSKGYFLLAEDASGNGVKPEPGPRVRCERDGAAMYLSEFLPERPSLRLWKCPLCRIVRANIESHRGLRAQPRGSNGQ